MRRFGLTSPCKRRRAAVMWLAACAMLSHALGPAALMAATGVVNPGAAAVKLTLCRASSQHETPGKPRPGLPAQHCAFCAVSETDLHPPQAALVPRREVARTVYARLAQNGRSLPRGTVRCKRGPRR